MKYHKSFIAKWATGGKSFLQDNNNSNSNIQQQMMISIAAEWNAELRYDEYRDEGEKSVNNSVGDSFPNYFRRFNLSRVFFRQVLHKELFFIDCEKIF